MISDAPPQYLIERTYRAVESEIGRSAGTAGERPPFVVTFRVEQPAAGWLTTAVTRIEHLTALAANWDSYGAQPVTAEAAVAAVRFLLNAAYPEIAAPAVVPLPDGGVQLEWHRGGLDIEIAFSEAEPGIYVEDHTTGTSHESSLSDAAGQLLQLAPRLREA